MSTLENPAEWLIRRLQGEESSSGQQVTYSTSLTIAYVWEALSIISGDVASLPFETRRREADGDLVNDMMHPAYRLMNSIVAGGWLSSYTLRETMTHYALLVGNAMAFILRDQMGLPVALVPAVPGDLRPELRDGELVYVWQSSDEGSPYERGTWFPSAEVLHIRGLGDFIAGHSVLTLARNSFGLALAEDKHGAKHFKNGGGPNIILKHPGKLTKQDADALLDRFEERHQEPGRPALAAGGLEIHTLATNNRDSQWLEARKQTIVEVASWFNLPPHKLGDDSRIAYNGITAENQAYITQCLRRWLKRWEVEVWGKLMSRREREQWLYECRHDPRPLLDMDTKQVTDEVVSQVNAKLITYNEGRRRLGYTRLADGDVRENPNTSTSAPATGDQQQAAASADRPKFVALLADRLHHLAATIKGHADRKLRKGEAWEDWTVTCDAKLAEYVEPSLSATATVFPCWSYEAVQATVRDWGALAQSGQEIYPQPAELAEQIVGGATCTS